MSPVLLVIAALLALRLGAELWLGALNRREVRRHAEQAPPAVAAVMDAGTYRRSVAYTLAQSRFGVITELWGTLVLVTVLFSGVLPWLWSLFAPLAPAGTWDGALFLLAAGVLLALPDLPFDWWGTFRLEARFGFNQSTLGLWISDKLKGVAVAAVIGFPLLWALLALVERAGERWWLWGFGLMFVFQLLMLVLYPRLILPLFNKLTPLPAGDLRTQLMALADRTGFRAKTIEVMDGSKRSGHSNAFFTGFGRFRRIVLYDTLVQQLTLPELEAVLAHEIGHYRRGHIPRMIVLSAAMQLGGFAAVAWLARTDWFNPAFGFAAGEMAPAFLLFALLSGLATFWFSPVLNLLSRRHEYEADAFARDAMGDAAPLVGALRKLAQKNLSNLTPHPWFSGFHYSHPTLVERERAVLAAPAA